MPPPDELFRALIDPTAPLPATWPPGALGVLLLFCVPIGGGIPLGVIMARDAGLSPLTTAGLYFISDLVLAVTAEPLVALVRWLSQRIEILARVGARLARLTGSAGLQDGRVRGPLGLILVAFSISPTTGRAAAAAAGHGFFSGWTLAIVGDMAYFGLLLVTTLWVSSVSGDDRLTVGAVLLVTWVLPLAIRRLRRRNAGTVPAAGHAAPALSVSAPPAAAAARLPRPRSKPARRRQPSRGIHR